jgi:hypothetical protein
LFDLVNKNNLKILKFSEFIEPLSFCLSYAVGAPLTDRKKIKQTTFIIGWSRYPQIGDEVSFPRASPFGNGLVHSNTACCCRQAVRRCMLCSQRAHVFEFATTSFLQAVGFVPLITKTSMCERITRVRGYCHIAVASAQGIFLQYHYRTTIDSLHQRCSPRFPESWWSR